jgi:hypothetical protein
MGDYGDPYMRKDQAGPPGRTKAQNRATVQQLKLVRLLCLVSVSASCRVLGFVMIVSVGSVLLLVGGKSMAVH